MTAAGLTGEALLEQMGTGVMPKLPQEVYDDRYKRCRELMAEAGLDVMVVYSNAMEFAAREWARYFANYVHPYWNSETFTVIPLDGEPAFLINYGFMTDMAREGSPIDDVRSPLERFGGASRYAGLGESLAEILKDRGVAKGPVGVVYAGGQGDWSPYPLREVIDGALGNADVRDAHELLVRLTLKKTPYDLEMIRKASEIMSAGLDAAFAAAGVGVPEYEPYLSFQRTVIEAGCDSPLFHYVCGSGPSAHIALRPLAATGRRFQSGDLFMIDAGICYQGYYADVTRTAAIDELSEEGYKLWQATQEVVGEMTATLVPGERAGRSAEVMWEGIKKRGYSKSHPLIGHGIGHFVNEPPFVMPWQDMPLEEGMVINLEPAIYHDDVGGVRIEDPYLIKADGAERLTTHDQGPYVA